MALLARTPKMLDNEENKEDTVPLQGELFPTHLGAYSGVACNIGTTTKAQAVASFNLP